MTNKNFTLRIEPDILKEPIILRGIEVRIGLNVNGIEVLDKRDGTRGSVENICRIVYWLLEKYPQYTSVGMPKLMSPAVELFHGINQHENEYCRNIAPKGHEPYMYPLPVFEDWRYSHALGHHDMTLPIVFQRRSKDKMEISWDLLPMFYKNPKGCEYVPLEIFQKGITDPIDRVFQYLENSNQLINDSNNELPELKRLRESIR